MKINIKESLLQQEAFYENVQLQQALFGLYIPETERIICCRRVHQTPD